MLPNYLLSENLLRRLVETASKSNISTKHSAAIIKGTNKIVASGFNNNRTCMSGHPVCSQHAETAAVMDLLSQNQARQSLKMVPNGKWFFQWDKAIAKPDKEVQTCRYKV